MAADEELDGMDDLGEDADFSDQLDDFMDGDEGGGDDGDSELDSFFEDLSTIDDLEVKEPEEEEEAEEEDFEIEDDEPMPIMQEAPAEEKPSLVKPALITSFIGMFLGAITVGVLYFMNKPEPVPIPVATPKPVPPPIVFEAPPPIPEEPPPPPKPKGSFYVQVANCLHQECVDDYTFLLKRHGYDPKTVVISRKNSMTEIVSRETVREEPASRWVERINRENQLTGKAYRKKAGAQYRISMGYFPDLDTANRVKAHLNQLYTARLFFEAKRAQQVIQYRKIRVGPFEEKRDAVSLQKNLLKRDKRFKGSFIIELGAGA